MKKCPYCAEEIQDEAIVCRYCGKDLTKPLVIQEPITTPAAVAPVQSKWSGARILFAIGATLLLLGAFLPWVTASSSSLFGLSKSVTGIEGDGIITAGIGAVLLIVAILAHGKIGKSYSILGAIIAFLAILLLISKFTALGSAGSETFDVTLGSGLYISLLGSGLAILGGLIKVT